MKIQFNLSNLEDIGDCINVGFSTEDIKEFIKKLKETEIDLRKVGLSYEDGVKAWRVMNEFIDELAGDKLI